MSNQVTIEPTKFENVRSGSVTKGYRMYDDYGATYCNQWDSIPDDDLAVLAKVLEDVDNTGEGMLESVEEHESGISIGGEYYEWDQIKHLFQ